MKDRAVVEDDEPGTKDRAVAKEDEPGTRDRAVAEDDERRGLQQDHEWKELQSTK